MEVEDLTTGWLRRHLGWLIEESDRVVVTPIGEPAGLMGRVYRVSCAGHSCVFKGPPVGATKWRELYLATGLHDREMNAYRFLEGHPRIAPRCFWSIADPDGSGALVMEDIAQLEPPWVRFARGLTLGEAAAAAQTLAILHSLLATLGADALSPPEPWMYSASSAGLISAIDEGLAVLPMVVEERLPASFARDALLRSGGVNVRAVVAESHVGTRLTSICHGDAWAGNVLFAEQAALLIDWQFAMWGNPLSDVALLLLSSVEPDCRKRWTGGLLRHYHSTLVRRRELDYGFDDCLADFTRALPYAALVATATLDAYTSECTPSTSAFIAARMAALLAR